MQVAASPPNRIRPCSSRSMWTRPVCDQPSGQRRVQAACDRILDGEPASGRVHADDAHIDRDRTRPQREHLRGAREQHRHPTRAVVHPLGIQAGRPPASSHAWQLPMVGWRANGSSVPPSAEVKIRTR
jgi:hypothetical protein